MPQVEYLRARAVMVVILDHLGILPAGFLGVDIFFVISGFVISKAMHGSGRSSTCLATPRRRGPQRVSEAASDSGFDVVCLDGSRARLSTARGDAEQDLER